MDRQKIKKKMRKITDNKIFIQIYQILRTDPSFKPSMNSSGIYYDMVPLDEITVETINDLISESVKTESSNTLSYNSYYNETYSNKLENECYKLKH